MAICDKLSSLDIANNIKSIYFAIEETDVNTFNTPFVMEKVADYLDIQLHYFDEPSEANNLGGRYRIFLNQNQSTQKQWQDFGHELGHILIHEGCQRVLPYLFRQYQEGQARIFACNLCVPRFLVQQLYEPDIFMIMRCFNVEYEFALKCLELYQSKILECVNDGKFSTISN